MLHHDPLIQRRSILAVIGPTGVGKTQFSLRLAEKYPVELISVDSMLVYKGFDIGTAKPTQSELEQVPHHMIDIFEPQDHYSVSMYCESVYECIRSIRRRDHIPVLVGGSMMYVWALMNGLSQLPSKSSEYRSHLEKEILNMGSAYLWDQLKVSDPKAASCINPNDHHRLIRALEVIHLTGRPYTDQLGLIKSEGLDLSVMHCWPNSRSVLYDQINQRFLKMLSQGFIEEVEKLYDEHSSMIRSSIPMRAVGYRQVSDYLNGAIIYDEMISKAQQVTRHLAKRQLTWMRKIEGFNAIFDQGTLSDSLSVMKWVDGMMKVFLSG